jgi:DNA-nicking Smr family endonuclease
MATERDHKERRLTEEEAELWAYVTRDAKGLRRRRRKAAIKPTTGDSKEDEAASPPAAVRDAGPPPPSKAAGGPSRAPASVRPADGPLPLSPPPLAAFDWRQARRLAKGREEIEARLDLHGRRQHEAHAALRSFLYGCRARGFRHVLVITGKGGRRAESANGWRSGEDRGVLRRLAPEWLREPEFREIVVSFTESHERHGGEGALYIKLRRLK